MGEPILLGRCQDCHKEFEVEEADRHFTCTRCGGAVQHGNARAPEPAAKRRKEKVSEARRASARPARRRLLLVRCVQSVNFLLMALHTWWLAVCVGYFTAVREAASSLVPMWRVEERVTMEMAISELDDLYLMLAVRSSLLLTLHLLVLTRLAWRPQFWSLAMAGVVTLVQFLDLVTWADFSLENVGWAAGVSALFWVLAVPGVLLERQRREGPDLYAVALLRVDPATGEDDDSRRLLARGSRRAWRRTAIVAVVVILYLLLPLLAGLAAPPR